MKSFKEFLAESIYNKIGVDESGQNIQYNVTDNQENKVILNITFGQTDSSNTDIVRLWSEVDNDKIGFMVDKETAKKICNDILEKLK